MWSAVMSDSIYKDLAKRLDATPNGFTQTESGIELRLLAKIFRPEEARLASNMRWSHEPATEIAARAGIDPAVALGALKAMRKKGLVSGKKVDEQPVFGLEPFMVGIYENQLGRMDEEMAQLFEQYFVEVKGGSMIMELPAIHRVVPVEKSIPIGIEIFPYERAAEMLNAAQSWGARECICRVQQRLVGKGCDSEVNCLIFSSEKNVFDRSELTKAISKEEALEILNRAQQAGLIHTTGNYQDDVSYICNCCTCCCGIVRGVSEFGNHSAIARSDFLASVDSDICSGCEECLDRCKFGALSVPENSCVVDRALCVGCGLCVAECLSEALELVRRPEEETLLTPKDENEWFEERVRNRHISLHDVL
jgi:Na+-translocating ferredoxin:NAD+ oxidoreductase RNF subunit RnfB